MTAQSLILTKDVVVVGSDLAITTPDNKSYTTGKKIFSPDSNYPVAVMINGYIDFEDISLETLIGEFAKNTNFNNVKTIKEIKNSFIDYLQKNTQYTSSDEYLRWILDSFKENIAEEINEYGFKDVISYKKKEKNCSHSLKNMKISTVNFLISSQKQTKGNTIRYYGKYFHMNYHLKEVVSYLQGLMKNIIIPPFSRLTSFAMTMGN